MCEKEKRIIELEKELAESHQREADLFKTIAEGKNFESQIRWRPWQIALVPVIIAVVGGTASIMIALVK
jgi:hypothetical protein